MLENQQKVYYQPEKEMLEGFDKALEDKVQPLAELMKAVVLCHNATIKYDRSLDKYYFSSIRKEVNATLYFAEEYGYKFKSSVGGKNYVVNLNDKEY